jgi:hypothetical protein
MEYIHSSRGNHIHKWCYSSYREFSVNLSKTWKNIKRNYTSLSKFLSSKSTINDFNQRTFDCSQRGRLFYRADNWRTASPKALVKLITLGSQPPRIVIGWIYVDDRLIDMLRYFIQKFKNKYSKNKRHRYIKVLINPKWVFIDSDRA